MWQVLNIAAKNFFSYKSFEYKIVNNQLTTVYGINKDAAKKKSNGSGKSTVLDAISFALTGDTLKKLKSIKEIINNEENDCDVLIDLENKVLKKTLTVMRSLSVKSSQKIIIFINGKEQDQLTDLHPRESDKFIQQQLGISFDDLLNYYLISKFRYQSLFLANDSAKKEVINRFSKADIIDEVFPIIKKDLDIKNDLINTLNARIVEKKTAIGIYEKQLEDLINENDETKKTEKINLIKVQIKAKEIRIKEINKEISDLDEDNINQDVLKQEKQKLIKDVTSFDKLISAAQKKWSDKKKEYDAIRNKYADEYKKIDEAEKKWKSDVLAIENDINAFHKVITDNEKYIAGEIECPKCKHHFILADSDFDVEAAKKENIEFGKEKEKSEKVLEEIEKKNTFKKDREDIDKKISKEQQSMFIEVNAAKEDYDKQDKAKLAVIQKNNSIKIEISNIDSKVSTNSNAIKVKQSQIKAEEKYIEQYNQDIVDIKANKNTDKIKEINTLIEVASEAVSITQDEIELCSNDIQRLEEWNNKFKRFKTFLANQALAQIQGQSNYYLSKMKSDLTVTIDGFRELANKKIKEEITVELSRDGINSESFGKFSGGEKAITDLSCILAMQNIINSTSSSGGFAFLGIDEVLESCDAETMNDITKCLSNLNQTIVLIAHSSPDQNMDCNKLIVEKKNGVSTILN